MFVRVDKQRCSGYGLCSGLCPEVYKLDDDGIAFVEDELVPRELEQRALEGAEACPEAAIAVSSIPFDEST